MGNWGQKLKFYKKDVLFKSLIGFCFILVFFCSLVFALQGSGTIGDPYLIHNWTELDSVRDDLSANYKLVGNLSSEDSDFSTFNSGNGWNPIGNDTHPFTGTFDGNGHTISYLYSYRPTTNYVGLFGYISSTSTIYNVSLVQYTIYGYWATGGIVGENDGGIIKDSFASGKLLASTTVGGLVGINLGTINNTYSLVNVTSAYYSGGLVGYNDGSVLNSYSTGPIGNDYGDTYSNGLIGSKGASSVVTNSYYNNLTTGQNDPTIYGLARNTTHMTSNPYDATTYVDWDFNSTWLNNTNIVYDPLGNSGYPALSFQSVTDTISPYAYGSSVNNTKVSISTLFSISIKDNLPLNPNGYYIFSTDNEGAWANESAVNFTLSTQTINVTKTLSATPKTINYKWYVFDGSENMITYSSSIESYSIQGSGTEDDPYLITTWDDLDGVRNNLGSHYKLTTDLSSTSSGYATYNSGEGFAPIGNFAVPFTGVLDGDGHTISDLQMINNTDYVALFSWANGATVANIGFVDVNISGGSYVGTIFDRLGGDSSIFNSYVTGTINGSDYVGGMCGNCGGITIRNSYVNIDVTGVDNVGGIGGYSGDALYNSYTLGNVTGAEGVGGLFGTTDSLIVNSYSSANVTGTAFTHGYVGSSLMNGPIVISVLWDINSSGQIYGIGTSAIGGRNTTQMKNSATYQLPTSRTNITNGYFETGDLTGWTTGGNESWQINGTVFEGSYSGKSGDITGNEYTWINQSITTASDLYLNFWWKVSSEGGGYDNLVFCLDDPTCTRSAGYDERIYGTSNPYWEMISTSLPTGTYSAHWLYGKDSSGDIGLDSGWIDNIFLTTEDISGLDQEWDFTNIWDINGATNDGYPFLNFTGIDVTLVSPTDASATSSFSQTFNCSVTSLYTPKNVTLMIWASNGSLIHSNKTAVNTSLNYSIFDYTFSEDDTYKWNCEYSDIYYNRNSKATNNTLYVSTISPAINIFYPSNNQYLNSGTNVNLNFSAYDSDGLSTCSVWGNFTGTWEKNSTFITPVNGVENSLELNLSDNPYLWGVFCNDTYGNEKTTYNSTVTIDTIDPIPSVDSISTTNNSQTISFNSSATDTNMGSCKYSIYNSTGSIDGLNLNVSISCNVDPHPATVTGYANFTLRVYSTDLATNEDYDDLNFTTSQVNGTTIVLGGGGGANGGEVEKIPTVAIIKIDETGRFSDLQRTILFARINSLCSEKKTGSTTLTIQDFSSGECSLKKSDLEILRANLAIEGLSIEINDLSEFYYNFNEGELEQTFHTLDEIREYDLFTSVLGIINPMLINPPRLDRPFIISQTEGNTTIEYIFTVNKDIRDCSILSGEGFECEILTNSSVKMILYINDTDFFDKIFKGEMSITSEADPTNLEVKRISLLPRVYNISYPIAGIPALWILIFLGVVILVLSIFFITRTRLQKELKRRFK